MAVDPFVGNLIVYLWIPFVTLGICLITVHENDYCIGMNARFLLFFCIGLCVACDAVVVHMALFICCRCAHV